MGNIAAAIEALSAQLGEKVSTSDTVRTHHGQNETYFAAMPPDAVVFPECTEDVVTAVKICAQHTCPIVPWGVGTSLEGHALPVRGGVTLSFERMARVLDVSQSDLVARVEPGVTREALNEELRATGLFFPIDPGANATLGGMAATRASGTTAVRYGTLRDNVLAMTVVMADGRVIKTGTRAKKSSAGYDLTALIVGSEGTLGVITELTLKLHGQPEAIAAAVCAFPSVDAAVDTTIQAVQLGIPVARMELVDALSMRCINAYSNTNYPEEPHLFMEFHGSEAGVAEQSETLEALAAEHGGRGFQWTTRTEERSKLWAARHTAYWAIKAMWPGRHGMSTDVCVPISKLSEAIAAARADVEAHNLPGPIVGHVGDGNYHVLLLSDPKDPSELDTAKAIARRMAEHAISLGGTVTGEHGIGMGKMDLLKQEHGEGVSVMASIKRALDPDNLLNPGKIVQIN
ncbi:MAG: FAD-linked oxidase C-terminal domain-containing protein [Pseudomonadota bacterium]